MRRFYDNVWVVLEGVQLATMDYHNVWIVLGCSFFFGGSATYNQGLFWIVLGCLGAQLTTIDDIQWGSEWQTRRK